MSWTKRQFVVQAFEEIGYASYTYDIQPEQLQAGLRRLEAMMGTWNGRGIRLGYPLSSNPDSAELDVSSNVPDSANEAIYTNLAIRIAPIVGKDCVDGNQAGCTQCLHGTAEQVHEASRAASFPTPCPPVLATNLGDKISRSCQGLKIRSMQAMTARFNSTEEILIVPTINQLTRATDA
jgi:hypothetical protein